MELVPHIAALSPPLDALEKLIGDVEKILLFLAVAYLAYAFAYIGSDYFAGRNKPPCRYFRRFFRAIKYLLIMLIAALYALAYHMSVTGAAHT
jgi:hypothetical protein